MLVRRRSLHDSISVRVVDRRQMNWCGEIFRMRVDFNKGHAAGARNVPYYLTVTPNGQLLVSSP